jgi:hypothetical protein
MYTFSILRRNFSNIASCARAFDLLKNASSAPALIAGFICFLSFLLQQFFFGASTAEAAAGPSVSFYKHLYNLAQYLLALPWLGESMTPWTTSSPSLFVPPHSLSGILFSFTIPFCLDDSKIVFCSVSPA